MLGPDTAEGPLVINTFEQESTLSPSKSSKGPVTPELEQSANRGRFGLPTPDTTPESLRVVPGNRKKQVFARPSSPTHAGPVTPSISSRASFTEEIADNIDHGSRHSIHTEANEEVSREPSLLPNSIHTEANEEISGEPSLLPTPPYLDDEEIDSSVSAVKSIFNSILSFLNLAKQRGSRADDARVQDIIALIKDLPTIKRTRVKNFKRILTAKQYGELLKALDDTEDEDLRPHLDTLRFDYTRSKKLLEIRMPTTMHGGMEDFIKRRTFRWQDNLEESRNVNISNAAKTIMPSANASVMFPYPRGASDTKSPDWRIGHKVCERLCTHPTLVMEFGWTQVKSDLQAKAETYMRRSKGEIRTVVGILMRDMYLAEDRNEKRLKEMYIAGEIDAAGSYSYWEDEMNETGEASILVWRRKIQNRMVKAECCQDDVFRDNTGNPVESVSLHLPVQDFICEGIVSSPAGRFHAPELEISSEDLCRNIHDNLIKYRQERVEVVRKKAEDEKRERRQKEEAQKSASRRGRTRGASDRAAGRNEDEGLIMAYGRRVSARLRGKK
ncbi:hypothetical protein F4803DRAFT_560225 [Xylaria telfairii]|nr:hypothetical protein F4803DRAFT_560225 [Xylaria telfairii]